VAAEVPPELASIIPKTVRGRDGIRHTQDDVPFKDLASAISLLGIDVNSRQDIAQRFTINDTTTRITSTARSGESKRRIVTIVKNRTGKPILLSRTIEIIP
jgi:hypothetical protein